MYFLYIQNNGLYKMCGRNRAIAKTTHVVAPDKISEQFIALEEYSRTDFK